MTVAPEVPTCILMADDSGATVMERVVADTGGPNDQTA
jgi:hypothetical protein